MIELQSEKRATAIQLEPGPPEYQSIEAALAYLMQELWRVRLELGQVQTSLSLCAYSVNDLARRFNVTIQTMRNNPWNLPNYGHPDIGKRPGKWMHETVIKWYSIPEHKRRERWDMMKSAERRKVMNGSIPAMR